jgi:general secretion pathway protein M
MNAFMEQIQQGFDAFWMERSVRERKQIGWAAAVAVCGLIYLLFIGPALNGRAQLEKRLPELRMQAAELQNLSREAASLSAAAAAAPTTVVTKESIDATLASKGLKPQSVVVGSDIIKVQFANVSFSGLLDWLDEMQRSAHVSVVDANIIAQAQDDIVNAILTLKQSQN